jgi:hypothetical protein
LAGRDLHFSSSFQRLLVCPHYPANSPDETWAALPSSVKRLRASRSCGATAAFRVKHACRLARHYVLTLTCHRTGLPAALFAEQDNTCWRWYGNTAGHFHLPFAFIAFCSSRFYGAP